MQGKRIGPSRHAAQRGTAYVLVLGVTTLFVVFGVAGAMVSRVTVQRAALNEELAIARLAAEVGLDVMHKRMDGETDWRDTATEEGWSSDESLADARVSFRYPR